MPRFRVFFVDRYSGGILSSIEFEAADEAQALALAEDRRCQTAMELWEKGGLIKRWEPSPPNG